MRIVGLALRPEAGWPGIDWPAVQPGLNVVYGPHGAGKTTVWRFLSHVLYGRREPSDLGGTLALAPQGEIVVERGNSRYRLRRSRDEAGATRLKIASIDGAPVDENTIHSLLHGLSPQLLTSLFAVSFESTPDFGRLLSAEFAREIESIGGPSDGRRNRRLTELAARRDVLAQELETRIAGERRVSQELDGRWRELDRRVRDAQQVVAADQQRLQAVDTALAETDARLRYRRLELNTQLQLQADSATDLEPEINELDHQIAKWRGTLGELSERESALRGRLAQLPSARRTLFARDNDQRAWLTMSRQLAADLSGEVARLARASQSQQCVCHDAHPRLRPISESIQRQFDVLQTILQEQHEARRAAAIEQELEQLRRAQDELRRHVEILLDRRHSLNYSALPYPTSTAHDASKVRDVAQQPETHAHNQNLSEVDADQLERRRAELEQQRYELCERLRAYAGKLRDLKAQRDTVERQRAALLSARSIEHVQRELADVQRKLQLAAAGAEPLDAGQPAVENPVRASDFLAQLTDGQLVRLLLVDGGRAARVINRAGETVTVDALAPGERDQVYLSLCLALVSSAAHYGVTLPVVLDDPFARLDSNGTAALATVLGDFCRQGHQVLVGTGQAAAAQRLASIGAVVNDITQLRRPQLEAIESSSAESGEAVQGETDIPAKVKSRSLATKKRRKKSSTTPLNGKSSHTDRSDAA